MNSKEQNFLLPKKLPRYLGMLGKLYKKQNEDLLEQIVLNHQLEIHEGWEHDNWDGGIDGHGITLTVNEVLFYEIIDDVDHYQQKIKDDINKICNIPGEWICVVAIEVFDDENGIIQPISKNINFTNNDTIISQAELNRIWEDKKLRIFLSHKATFKEQTVQLKLSLARYGISGFVAHEDIEPTEEWQKEIENALFSMDALVALLTEDFHESDWTDQEVGVAIGRKIPLITVKLGMAPYGIMGKNQGLGGCDWSNTLNMAKKIYKLLHKKFVDKSKLLDAAIMTYSKSDSFDESTWNVKNLLAEFTDFSKSQIEDIKIAFSENGQNNYSYKGRNLLSNLLNESTNSNWKIEDDSLIEY